MDIIVQLSKFCQQLQFRNLFILCAQFLPMQLFPDEKMVSTSNDNTIFLTTHRIYQEEKGFSSSTTKSIMLEHITSCSSLHKKNFFWIFVALVGASVIVYSMSENEDAGFLAGGGLIVVGLVLFFITQRGFIRVASPSADIMMKVSGMKRPQITEFIDLVELTKHQRVTALRGA